MVRTIVLGLALWALISAPVLAEEGNIFLERSFWKTNPSVEVVKEKIAAGHDATELNQFAFDAVSWALIEKVDNSTILFLLQQEGNGVNKLTHDGRTYIFWAAYRNNMEIMRHLIKNGAKTDIIDSHGYSLLNFAAVTGQKNPELYDFCIKHGSDPLQEKNREGANALLLVAPFLKDFTMIDYFVEKGLSLESTDNAGNGIFNYAAKNGNTEMLDQLIAKGVSYKGLTKEGGNAMITASQGTRSHTNTLETFQYLEKMGIEPNVTTKDGVTPLHALARKSKDLKLFRYFIEKGVDLNQKDEDGNTPFLRAAYNNNLECLKLMVQHDADVNLVNNKGQSPLMMAVRGNAPEVVAFLLENGASADLKDQEGNSLAYYLLESFKAEKQASFDKKREMLQAQKVNFADQQGNGNTLYHQAVLHNDPAMLQAVAQMNIPINAKNKEGVTALHLAAMKSKDAQILKWLLEQGADNTIVTDFEETAYGLAQENELLAKNNISIEFLK